MRSYISTKMGRGVSFCMSTTISTAAYKYPALISVRIYKNCKLSAEQLKIKVKTQTLILLILLNLLIYQHDNICYIYIDIYIYICVCVYVCVYFFFMYLQTSQHILYTSYGIF